MSKVFFPKIMWNHFETVEFERTNNYVKGNNQCFFGAANPNMDNAVKLLRSYETTSDC